MNILIEAIFLKFEYITGIERHFFLQLEIIDKSKIFEKIFIVTKKSIPKELIQINTDYEVVVIESNVKETWEKIYKRYKFSVLYSTFEPPEYLPDNNISILYVLHDPGRYIFPDMMEKGTLDKHIKNFGKYIKRNNFYILTVSESSKNDIIKLFPSLFNKTFVLYNFLSTNLLNTKAKKSSNFGKLKQNKFFLMIGRYIPTKNTLIVAKAFQNRSLIFQNYSLVIVGRKGWYYQFDDFVQKSRDNSIILYDFISDEAIIWLYKNCYALINASLYEGFGLPIIEAAFFNCKRIMCSNIPVFREILPNATVLFPTDNQAEIEKQIFEKMYAKKEFSYEIKTKFSLEKSVEQFTNIINSIITHGESYKTKI
ncbi:MAG: glycosyltransferase family 4 protein [Ignavibacteria bacterium]|nr:glycosyltransferase family 4 protein [Ignavibacteria bacterium]